MTNIRDSVWKLIDKDPSIRLDLERDMINVRALARHCRDNGIEGSEDAIISAIRRYPKENKYLDQYKEAAKLIRGAKISTKSHLAIIAVKKSPKVTELLSEIFNSVKYEKGEMIRFVQGEESIRVMIDESKIEEFLDIVSKEYIIDVKKNIAEINLHLPPVIVKTRGVGLVILNELFRNNVLIYELMTCVPEFLIFVEDAELLKAYEVLFDLCSNKKKHESRT
ncbi:MAG: hypothetical protein AABX38_00220 [Candidatus Micrarchaeota archaeon]